MRVSKSLPTSINRHTHSIPSTGPMESMSATDGMSAMSSTFSASTRVTLWFTEWTTTTTTTYVLTMFFLFFLGLSNRFVGALKSQLDRKRTTQRDHATASMHTISGTMPADTSIRGHTRQWSQKLRSEPIRLESRDRHETEPLSPALQLYDAEEHGARRQPSASRKSWVADAPWSVTEDGIRAVLEFVRALIGYILYAPKVAWGTDSALQLTM